MRRVREQLEELAIRYVMLNQRDVASIRFDATVAGGRAVGTLGIGSESYPLEDFTGVLIRMMDGNFLPEIVNEAPDSALRQACTRLHVGLHRWFEVTDALVLNRPSASCSNGSKPYQAQLIAAQGFSVPDTLITTDPGAALAFRDHHGSVIYKSISSVRSIVHCLEDRDLDRLDAIGWCPVQFQEHIDGYDLRVHTVGDETFATAIRSEYSDYRYAARNAGEPARLEAVEIDGDLATRCVRLARSLGLTFAGIDLRLTPDGRQVCFEVNPSPAFSYYEANTGQPIAAAVARCLARTPTPALC